MVRISSNEALKKVGVQIGPSILFFTPLLKHTFLSPYSRRCYALSERTWVSFRGPLLEPSLSLEARYGRRHHFLFCPMVVSCSAVSIPLQFIFHSKTTLFILLPTVENLCSFHNLNNCINYVIIMFLQPIPFNAWETQCKWGAEESTLSTTYCLWTERSNNREYQFAGLNFVPDMGRRSEQQQLPLPFLFLLESWTPEQP